MNSLDPRSLIVMGGMLALILGIVMAATRRYYPTTIWGLGYWTMAPAAMLGAAVLFALPIPWYPEFWRWLANALILMGFLMFHVGYRRFYGKPAKWRRIVFFYAASLLLLAWYGGVEPSYRMRVAVTTAAIALMHVASLVFLWRNASLSPPVLVVQASLALHLGVLLVRMQTVLAQPEGGSLLEPSPVQTFYIGAYVMSAMMQSLGSLLMAADRVRSEFEHLAAHDTLTATLNRRAIMHSGAVELERSLRYTHPVALMMVDLDHFKSVNDAHGHQHGDRVLQHFCEVTRATLRQSDHLGRYGGEEFLIVLPHTTAEAAVGAAARIHQALGQGHPLACTVSIGLTSFQGEGDSLDTMLSRADAALYKAKDEGRNRTCVA